MRRRRDICAKVSAGAGTYQFVGRSLTALALAFGAPRMARAETACAPAALLDGDATVAATVNEKLRARGVGDRPDPRCPLVVAHVVARGDQLDVTIVAEQRRIERLVADAETVTTLIESWARGDITAPLWALRDAPSLGAPVAVAAAAPAPRGRFVVGAAAEGAVGFDGSFWVGGRLDAATRVGPLRLGLVARVLADTPTGAVSEARRLGVDLLLRLGWPIALGQRMRLTPAIGGGVGWLRTAWEDTAVGSGGLRGEASLTFGVLVGRGLEIDLEAAVAGNLAIGTPQVPTGDDDFTHATVPTLPAGMARLGLGLRWSSP